MLVALSPNEKKKKGLKKKSNTVTTFAFGEILLGSFTNGLLIYHRGSNDEISFPEFSDRPLCNPRLAHTIMHTYNNAMHLHMRRTAVSY